MLFVYNQFVSGIDEVQRPNLEVSMSMDAKMYVFLLSLIFIFIFTKNHLKRCFLFVLFVSGENELLKSRSH